jgi:hypothetical protein
VGMILSVELDRTGEEAVMTYIKEYLPEGSEETYRETQNLSIPHPTKLEPCTSKIKLYILPFEPLQNHWIYHYLSWKYYLSYEN